MNRLALVSLALLGGCVYPATEPTGMELSWRFVEQELSDGEDAVRVRTCAGAIADQLAVSVEDSDDPQRQGVFRFDCVLGFQTATDFQTQASDAFIRLDPGRYAVTMRAVDDAANAVVDEEVDFRDVEVESRGVTVVTWELQRAPVSWSLELQGTESCDSMTLALYYATPEVDLAEYVADDEQSLPLYRTELVSDRGLGVAGEAIACDTMLSGMHRFEGLDRGEYLLEVGADGQVCAVRVDLRSPDDVAGVIDLASLPCAG